MKQIFALLILIITLDSCKKDNSTVCYVCADAAGNTVTETCGKDKDDARKNVTGTYNGTTYTYGNYPESEFNSKCRLK